MLLKNNKIHREIREKSRALPVILFLAAVRKMNFRMVRPARGGQQFFRIIHNDGGNFGRSEIQCKCSFHFIPLFIQKCLC